MGQCGLVGSISSALASLSALTLLDLGINLLSSTLPALPPSLVKLYVHDNRLSGTIPPVPASINWLDLRSNRFSGELPTLQRSATCVLYFARDGEQNCFTNDTCPLCKGQYACGARSMSTGCNSTITTTFVATTTSIDVPVVSTTPDITNQSKTPSSLSTTTDHYSNVVPQSSTTNSKTSTLSSSTTFVDSRKSVDIDRDVVVDVASPLIVVAPDTKLRISRSFNQTDQGTLVSGLDGGPARCTNFLCVHYSEFRSRQKSTPISL
jgi:hypothetical protein